MLSTAVHISHISTVPEEIANSLLNRQLLPRFTQKLPGVLESQPFQRLIQRAPSPNATLLWWSRLALEYSEEVFDSKAGAEEAILQ